MEKTYTKTTEQEQDAGLDDKYDWNASTEGDREATYEDEWTFESLEKGLQSHLNEGKKSNKRKLDEGYTMSITSR